MDYGKGESLGWIISFTYSYYSWSRSFHTFLLLLDCSILNLTKLADSRAPICGGPARKWYCRLFWFLIFMAKKEECQTKNQNSRGHQRQLNWNEHAGVQSKLSRQPGVSKQQAGIAGIGSVKIHCPLLLKSVTICHNIKSTFSRLVKIHHLRFVTNKVQCVQSYRKWCGWV